MRTALCDQLDIDCPIIQAAIGGAARAQLAAAVSNAGGLGTLALTSLNREEAREVILDTRALTAKPICANFILAYEGSYEDALEVALEEEVPAICLFWGDPAPLQKRIHDSGASLLVQVGTVEEGCRAVDGGADIIIAQGWEAGGHVRGTTASLVLIPSIVDAVAPTPVVAAGGVADGRGLAAVLMLGAVGAWIGTRFLGSQEAAVAAEYRERVFQTTASDTEYTTLFDIGWPEAPHRALRNSTYTAWERAGRPPSGQRPGEGETIARAPHGPIVRYEAVTARNDIDGDIEALPLWAGQAVGMTNKLLSAGEIVRELALEADNAINRHVAQR